jgi:hypothetical protein
VWTIAGQAWKISAKENVEGMIKKTKNYASRAWLALSGRLKN